MRGGIKDYMSSAGRIVAVGQDNLGEFLAYCQRYGREHDESFLPEGDDFELSQDSLGDPEYPAYLLLDGEQIAGAACLIRTPNFVRARKGRWMIFHARQPDPAWYRLLLDAMLQHAQGLDFLYGFVPEGLQATRAAWEQIGLTVQRYSYVLCWQQAAPPPVLLPPGFTFQSVDPEDMGQMESLRDVLNASFSGLAGHIGNTVETLSEAFAETLHLPGGMLLLYDGDRPVGSVRITRDEDPQAGFVEMLGVIPAYQGRGLGRLLIRKSIDFSTAQGFPRVLLSVNAENESAVNLYLSEGFQKDTVMVCYQRLLK